MRTIRPNVRDSGFMLRSENRLVTPTPRLTPASVTTRYEMLNNASSVGQRPFAIRKVAANIPHRSVSGPTMARQPVFMEGIQLEGDRIWLSC
jgi:hypothetical protein